MSVLGKSMLNTPLRAEMDTGTVILVHLRAKTTAAKAKRTEDLNMVKVFDVSIGLCLRVPSVDVGRRNSLYIISS